MVSVRVSVMREGVRAGGGDGAAAAEAATARATAVAATATAATAAVMVGVSVRVSVRVGVMRGVRAGGGEGEAAAGRRRRRRRRRRWQRRRRRRRRRWGEGEGERESEGEVRAARARAWACAALLPLFRLARLRFDGGISELLRGRAAPTRVKARSVTTRAEALLSFWRRSKHGRSHSVAIRGDVAGTAGRGERLETPPRVPAEQRTVGAAYRHGRRCAERKEPMTLR